MSKLPKFCSECGNPLSKDDKFCPHCGTLVTIESTEEALPEHTLKEPVEAKAEKASEDVLPSVEPTTHEDPTIKLDSTPDLSLNNEKTQAFDAVPLSSEPYPNASTQPMYSPTPTKEFPVIPEGAPQGQPVNNPQVYRADAPQKKQGLSKQQFGIIIGAAVVVVIALIVVIVLVVTGSNNANQKTTTQETQTTPQPSA